MVQVARAQQQALAALMQQAVPPRGALFVEYRSESGLGGVRVGVEFEYAAFVHEDGLVVAGRTAGGIGYAQSQDRNGYPQPELAPSEHFSEPSALYTCARTVPVLWLREAAERGRELQGLSATSTGGYEFSVTYEKGGPARTAAQDRAGVPSSPRTFWMEVDRHGRVVRHGLTRESATTYEYAMDAEARVPSVPIRIVPHGDAPALVLVRSEWLEDSAIALPRFEKDRAWAWAAEARGTDAALLAMATAPSSDATKGPRRDSGLATLRSEGAQTSAIAPSLPGAPRHPARSTGYAPRIVLIGAGLGTLFAIGWLVARHRRYRAWRARVFSKAG